MKISVALLLFPIAALAANGASDPFTPPAPQQSTKDVFSVSASGDADKARLNMIYSAALKAYAVGDKQEPVQLQDTQVYKAGKIVKVVADGQYLLVDCLVKALPGKALKAGDNFTAACVKEGAEYSAGNGLKVPVYHQVPAVVVPSRDQFTAWLKAGYKLTVTVVESRPDPKQTRATSKGEIIVQSVPTAVTYTVAW